MFTPAQINQRIAGMFPGTMGVEVTEVTPDRITGKLKVTPALCTAGDTLHGGAYMAFADTLGAVATLANMPANARTTTIESKTNFLGAAPVGSTVTGEATAFHKGRTTQVWQTQIRSEAGKLLAVVTQTQMVIPAG